MQRYEVRKSTTFPGKFDVFDYGMKCNQVTGTSKRRAETMCDQANKMAPPLKTPPPGLAKQHHGGTVKATAERLDRKGRKAIGR